jgi:hypothetical protein
LQRVEKSAFVQSGLTAVIVPSSVEVLCERCFCSCKSLTSVTFEIDSKLQRIEAGVFAFSDLTELVFPNSVHFLSNSTFGCSSLNAVSFWPGPCDFQVHELFIEDIAGRSLVCYFGRSSAIVIQSRIELVGDFCFFYCRSLTSVTFELNSKLQRIEESAFASSVLTVIIIPSSVEVLCKKCFSYCWSLTSVTFEMNSKLREVAADSFCDSPSCHPIEYPPSLYERSQVVVAQGASALSSSIVEKE